MQRKLYKENVANHKNRLKKHIKAQKIVEKRRFFYIEN